jgi:hypothetical protein
MLGIVTDSVIERQNESEMYKNGVKQLIETVVEAF